jgi:hypothetical protein
MIDFETLEPEFRDKLIAVNRDCIANGFNLCITSGTVSVEEQAKLWRRSKSDTEIDHAIFDLEQSKCPFLVDVLRKGYTEVGNELTDKLPGFSWKNFGEEVEVVASEAEIPVIKKAAKKHGLSLGDSFLGNKVLYKSSFETPLQVFTAQEIDQLMEKKWGNK